MKILILNGNPKQGNSEFDQYLTILNQTLTENSHDVTLFTLREMNLNDCIGCYSCWLKTPGLCCFKDDHEPIIRAYLASDIVLLASPIIMGFVSSLLKRVNDRLLPIMHPFLKMTQDRMTHVHRYDRYPSIGLLLDHDPEFGEVSQAIIGKVYGSSSRKLSFMMDTTNSQKEVAYAINNL